MIGRAAMKKKAGIKEAAREYRHPTERPRSSSQNVMAYPILKAGQNLQPNAKLDIIFTNQKPDARPATNPT
jgi:hypothetical protein